MTNVFSASNAEELMTALASAKGGDTIELAGGDYGDLILRGKAPTTNVEFDSTVKIMSADPENQAIISRLDLIDASNLKFENLIFNYEFQDGDRGWAQPFSVRNSDNITFSNSSFIGDVARNVSEIYDGYGTGRSLQVLNSKDIIIENNYFETAGKGLVLDRIIGLKVFGNEITDIREDGMNLIQVENALVENNYLHNFRTHPEDPGHRDLIQLWVLPTHEAPSKNVTISGNILDIGDGVYAQGIFMRNGAAEANPDDTSMYWQNITIENNVIYNNHTHGIAVGSTINLSVANNSLIRVDDTSAGTNLNMSPSIFLAENSQNVIVSGNIASRISGYSNQDGWDVNSNVLISQADYFKNFINSSMTSIDGANGFLVIPGGKADQLGAGSVHTRLPDTLDSLNPLFQVYSDPSSVQVLIFDASLTVGPLGLVSEDDAEFLWSFGSGGTATGKVVKHEFSDPGYHDVTLTVTSKDGTTAQAKFTAGIAGRDIANFDTQTGQFEVLAFGKEKQFYTMDGSTLETSEGYVLKLGGDGVKASIPRSEMSRFFGADAFELSMSFKADNSDSWGHLALSHMNFITQVDKSGNFVLTLFLDDGSRVNLASEGVTMNDGNVHNVEIRFDGVAGFAEIVIDGQLVASENVSGALGGDARDLMFGNPWNNQKFDGELSAFSLSASSLDFPAYNGEMLPVLSTKAADPVEIENSSTLPESDPVPAESQEELALLVPLLRGGYELDIAAISASGTVRLHDDAHISKTNGGKAIVLDGDKDYVSFGRLQDFEESHKIAFSIDFVSGNSGKGREILVWNHMKFGLSLEEGGLRVHANNTDNHFSRGFKIEGLELNDGERHSVTVMVDAEADRLQVVVNDAMVLDEQGTDFDFVGAGGREWGWSLSTPWSSWFEGKVYSFQVSDDFEFVHVVTEDGITTV